MGIDIPDQLVEACRRGEDGAFDDLVRLTHRPVYTLIMRIVGDPDEAADVTQEAYVRMWRGLKRFRGDASFSTWMYRVATNAALTHLKRRSRQGLATDPIAMPERTVEDGSQALADADVVQRAMRSLPAEARAVVVLKDMYGWTCEEIGREMGVSEGAIKVRLFRARRRLADELATHGVVVPLKNRKTS